MKRTLNQNSALHLYLERIAEQLNDAGYDLRKVIQLPVRFTQESVKENMLKPVMNAMFPDKHSTTELTTKELTELYETFNAALSDRLGVGCEFPSYESQLNESLTKEGK